MISAQEALNRLREGNARFSAGKRDSDSQTSPARRRELLEGQQPFAIILACADSRVPPEAVFDQGLGALFVVRVAGNVVAPSGLGSIEYCATMFATPLLVVLGHSRCGAVQAALEQGRCPNGELSGNLASVVKRIQPALSELVGNEGSVAAEDIGRAAEIANIHQSVQQLRRDSAILNDLVQAGKLTIIGAYYELGSGAVEFLG